MFEVNPYQDSMELAEAQLQEELRAMFEVDSQEYLQTYVTLVQQIHPESWTADIQELYRSIHTIKGMAVTVGADAVLQVATALEDLLSDLRYQTEAPNLADGFLSDLLQEAGELLTASLQIEAVGEAALMAVYPTTVRLQTIRQQIRQIYLPETNEKTQLFYEFAEQGFDLVVLDLEMALEQLPGTGAVPAIAIDAAKQTLAQLQQIGQDLEFAPDWTQLLAQGQTLLSQSDCGVWKIEWLPYLHLLKDSARKGGKFPQDTETSTIAPLHQPDQSEFTIDLESDFGRERSPLPEAELDGLFSLDEPDPALVGSLGFSTELNDFLGAWEDEIPDPALLEVEKPEDMAWIPAESVDTGIGTEVDFSESEASFTLNLPEVAAIAEVSTTLTDFFGDLDLEEAPLEASMELSQSIDLSGFTASAEDEPTEFSQSIELSEFTQPTELDSFFLELDDLSLDLATTEQAPTSLLSGSEIEWDVQSELAPPPAQLKTLTIAEPEVSARSTLIKPTLEEPTGKVQIPVSLQRLDRSAQNLVETLLAARASQGFYQNLQSQLVQLVSLAQDSAEYITRLRQVQDDYALLSGTVGDANDLSSRPNLERYRQGYSIINRLLETSLRLSEIGAEVSTSARQMDSSLQVLDRNILNLQKTVEESRLIPFKTLSFRTKGILRELSTRFNKPAQLLVQGENLELDAGTSQALEPVLLHLIRNAYDHGLESAEERAAKGKPPQGTIRLSLRRQGSSYLLEVQDDGRGINPALIQKLAEEKRLPLTCTDTPAELLAVLCQPGFSSSKTVSDVSGRGVGMDVVANQIIQLGGRLKLETTPEVGSIFRVQIPVPQLLSRCVTVRLGDLVFAIPREEIVTTALWGNLTAKPTEDSHSSYSWQIEDKGETCPGLDLLEYWYRKTSPRAFSDTAVCIRVRSLESTAQKQDIWLLADDLLEQVDLVIKPLPHPLVAPIGLTGLSMLADGKSVPVLDPSALAAHILSNPTTSEAIASLQTTAEATQTIAPPPVPSEPSSRRSATILVVDDAALVRRRLEASLMNYGYTVQACRDGLEAWIWLQSNPAPSIVITDIEMPNMDGFTLIDQCRQSGMSFPILVISSRLSEEWSKEVKRLGATDYLTKGFSTTELINKVKPLIESY